MAVDSLLEDEEENILYDLLINTEWPPETDTQVLTYLSCLSVRGCEVFLNYRDVLCNVVVLGALQHFM